MDSPTKSSLVAETVAAIKGVPTKPDLKLLLEQNVLVIDFTKLDGDKRVMTCTLREDMKPKQVVKEGATKKLTILSLVFGISQHRHGVVLDTIE